MNILDRHTVVLVVDSVVEDSESEVVVETGASVVVVWVS
jgi:hypothetical protein